MDIVSRIKSFISASGLSVSQFADTCEIARPTVSQLLNGRNKKVSDEIISKIHGAYPTLSMMWLMFGEGNMRKIEPNTPNIAQVDENLKFKDNSYSPSDDQILAEQLGAAPNISDIDNIEEQENKMKSILKNFSPQQPILPNEESKASVGKEIVNIMVFYSDNSFEMFKPSN